MDKTKLIFGIDKTTGKIRFIDEVKNGKACNCICPDINCNDNLIAKNNLKNKNKHHFAHETKNCKYSNESALHQFSKQLLKNQKFVILPSLTYKSVKIIEEQKITFDEIIIEDDNLTTIGNRKDNSLIKPDCIGVVGENSLIIEIKVSHAVDEEKLDKIKKLGLSAIEIDFSDIELSRNEIEKNLKSSTSIAWLNNSKAKDFFEKKMKQYANLTVIEIEKKYSKNYEIVKCPKYSIELEEFKKSKHFDNNLVQRILNGEIWNRKFYTKKLPTRIYIGDDKINIEPTMNELDKQIKDTKFLLENGLGNWRDEEYFSWLLNKKEQLTQGKYLTVDRDALNELKKVSETKFLGECKKCKYHHLIEGNFVICKFKNDKKKQLNRNNNNYL